MIIHLLLMFSDFLISLSDSNSFKIVLITLLCLKVNLISHFRLRIEIGNFGGYLSGNTNFQLFFIGTHCSFITRRT